MHAVCGTALEFSGSGFTVANSFFHLNGERMRVRLESIAVRKHPATCAGDHFGRVTATDQHSWSDGLTVSIYTRGNTLLIPMPSPVPHSWTKDLVLPSPTHSFKTAATSISSLAVAQGRLSLATR